MKLGHKELATIITALDSLNCEVVDYTPLITKLSKELHSRGYSSIISRAYAKTEEQGAE